MFAEQDEGGDIPAHNEHADRGSDNRGTEWIHVAEVFPCEVQWVGTKGFHKGSVHRTEQDEPEKKQDLVFPEMQEQ